MEPLAVAVWVAHRYRNHLPPGMTERDAVRVCLTTIIHASPAYDPRRRMSWSSWAAMTARRALKARIKEATSDR